MPRKSEISFETKKIIWDMAVKGYRDKYSAIQRHLDRVLAEQGLDDDTPGIKLIKRIINEDINELAPEVVVSELPRHLWELRDNYDQIDRLAKAKQTALTSARTKGTVEHDVRLFEKYNAIMSEFESEKASLNRGRIKNMTAKSEVDLKKAVDAARNAAYANKKRDTFEELGLNGLAIEETVASFEKMAALLVGNSSLQEMFAPWFWQTVLDCWMPLKIWVNFRLKTKDDKYQMAGFGQRFKQLAIDAKQRLQKEGYEISKYQIESDSSNLRNN